MDRNAMTSVLQNAAKSTAAVKQHVQTAIRLLADTRVSNAVGVFPHPNDAKLALIAARAQLGAAIATMDTTTWPTARDYDKT
jgi:hypothetical protein